MHVTHVCDPVVLLLEVNIDSPPSLGRSVCELLAPEARPVRDLLNVILRLLLAYMGFVA